MGLTIQYSLRSTTRSADEARRLVETVRQRALDLPFKHVGDVLDLSGAACDYEQQEKGQPNRRLLIQANQPIERDNYMYIVAPTRLIAFDTSPGEGSSALSFR